MINPDQRYADPKNFLSFIFYNLVKLNLIIAPTYKITTFDKNRFLV